MFMKETTVTIAVWNKKEKELREETATITVRKDFLFRHIPWRWELQSASVYEIGHERTKKAALESALACARKKSEDARKHREAHLWRQQRGLPDDLLRVRAVLVEDEEFVRAQHPTLLLIQEKSGPLAGRWVASGHFLEWSSSAQAAVISLTCQGSHVFAHAYGSYDPERDAWVVDWGTLRYLRASS
jgi:hypothetical protein